MNNEQYVSPARISKQFDISSGTLRRWAESGKIKHLRPNGTRRIYNVSDVRRMLGVEQDSKLGEYNLVCYARVSSSHQKEDLDRQIDMLKSKYPNARIIRDIASGLNWNRPGFNSILEGIHNGTIQEVVVAQKDRLCRFGFELVQWIFEKSNAKLVVLGSNPECKTASNELSDDLLAIVTVFVAKNNGLRAGQYRRERKENSKSETSN